MNSIYSIKITFIREEDGESITVYGREGESLLDVVVDNDVDLDGFGKLLMLNVSTESNLTKS